MLISAGTPALIQLPVQAETPATQEDLLPIPALEKGAIPTHLTPTMSTMSIKQSTKHTMRLSFTHHLLQAEPLVLVRVLDLERLTLIPI